MKKHYHLTSPCLLRKEASVKWGATSWADCLDSFSNPDQEIGDTSCRTTPQGWGWVTWILLWSQGAGEGESVRAGGWGEGRGHWALGREDEGGSPRGGFPWADKRACEFLNSHCVISWWNLSLVWSLLHLKCWALVISPSVFCLLTGIRVLIDRKFDLHPTWRQSGIPESRRPWV